MYVWGSDGVRNENSDGKGNAIFGRVTLLGLWNEMGVLQVTRKTKHHCFAGINIIVAAMVVFPFFALTNCESEPPVPSPPLMFLTLIWMLFNHRDCNWLFHLINVIMDCWIELEIARIHKLLLWDVVHSRHDTAKWNNKFFPFLFVLLVLCWYQWTLVARAWSQTFKPREKTEGNIGERVQIGDRLFNLSFSIETKTWMNQPLMFHFQRMLSGLLLNGETVDQIQELRRLKLISTCWL